MKEVTTTNTTDRGARTEGLYPACSKSAIRSGLELCWRKIPATARSLAPVMMMLMLSAASRAQGTIDFSQANTLMDNFKTFCIYAGAIIAFGCLVWAGLKMMGGRFQDAIPQLFGALFGAGVLGWGAGWISSLTGQTVS